MKRKIISLIVIFVLFMGIIPLNIQVTNAEKLTFNKLREVDK